VEHRTARIAVQSRFPGDGQALLFDGELWLELEGLHLARLRGRLERQTATPPVGLARLIRPPDRSFVDLQNAPVDGVWLPACSIQWIGAGAHGSAVGQLRIVTSFRDVRVGGAVPDGPAATWRPPTC
jgi:hypothetical protein